MYVQVGDFCNSRGPPTVPLMQILRNVVFLKSQNPRNVGTLCTLNRYSTTEVMLICKTCWSFNSKSYLTDRHEKKYYVLWVSIHSMAKDNLKKTEKNKIKTTTVWKLINLGDHYQQKLKLPFSDKNLLGTLNFIIVKQNLHHNKKFLKITHR